MPTYSYACTACDHRFDAVQAFTEDALTECPQCAGRLRKLFNSVGVVFKGSGFYRTDSREAAKSGTGSKSDSAGTSTASESSGSKESKESKESSSGASSGASSSSGGSAPASGSSTPAPATSS